MNFNNFKMAGKSGLSAFKQREAGIVNAVIETPMVGFTHFPVCCRSGARPPLNQTHVGTGALACPSDPKSQRLLS